MISMISNLSGKFGVKIHEGESFKQAHYNGRLTDTELQVKDKIELAAKHYPGRDLFIGTCESDETSSSQFAYAVVMPS